MLQVDYRRRLMSTFKFLGAAAILSALIASPAMAQHMIDEPRMYAFYHPNGDLGIGSTSSPMNAQAMVMVASDGKMVRHRIRIRSHSMAVRRVQSDW
jgi:hypothetical protein